VSDENSRVRLAELKTMIQRLTNEKKEHDLVAGKVICDKKRKQYDECLEAVLGN